jgi:hypothetical protein
MGRGKIGMEIDIHSPKYGKHIVLIDDLDYNLIKDFKLSVAKRKYTFYVTVSFGKISKQKLLHRYLLNLNNRNQMVDHVNGNGLDNRRENLRIFKNNQNTRNAGKHKTNSSSKYKGVSWCNTRNKWEANIKVNYKKKFLGYFESEIEAAKKYNIAAIKYFGEFARINAFD